MKWTMLALLACTAVTFGGESLEQRLSKRTLQLVPGPEGQTLAEVLDLMSREYRARYREALPIFIGVDLVQPGKTQDIKPSPTPKIPGLVPLGELKSAPDGHPSSARTSVTLQNVPVTELLRYVSSLAGVAFTIRDDVILIHAAAK